MGVGRRDGKVAGVREEDAAEKGGEMEAGNNWKLKQVTQAFTNRTNTHLFRTISIGTPGFTMAIFIHSLPRSTDMTATLTANRYFGHIFVFRELLLRTVPADVFYR